MEYEVVIPKNDGYRIILEAGCLSKLSALLQLSGLDDRSYVYITDRVVNELYRRTFGQFLLNGEMPINSYVLEGGEKTKSMTYAIDIIDYLTQQGIQRRSVLIAFGGGVITDLVGFVVSIYMRGVQYVNIPTTLISQLDASVGGKTAVNLASAKNLVGSFHHPSLVIIDPRLLKTLPIREIRQGLAEAIKVAMIVSEPLFNFIETNVENLLNKDIPTLERLIEYSVGLKLDLLEPDPYEQDLQRLLNFGHTVGHAIETAMKYTDIGHGEAISIGMVAETRLAAYRKICDNETLRRLEGLLIQVGLPINCEKVAMPDILNALDKISLIRGGTLNAVLPARVGSAVVNSDVNAIELLEFLFVDTVL